MTRNINTGFSSLNNSERFIGIPVEGKADLVYISCSDIVMVSQVAGVNTKTNIYYKSGTVQITHAADASEVLAGEIWKTVWKINQRESDVTEELVSSKLISAVTTGCSICKIPQHIVIGTGGPIPIGAGNVIILQIDGTKAFTLGNATEVGAKMTFVVDTATNTPNGVLTTATRSGAYNTILFNAVGQTVEMMWTGSGGWAIVSRSSGAVAGTAAVAGLSATEIR